jgi:alpha-L-rhamnosidase
MNSFAHYSFGAVYQWMVENIGGIAPGAPAYKEVRIAPWFDEKLTSASVRYQSIRGLVATEWQQEPGKRSLTVTIPANTTALLTLPARSSEQITESGRPVAQAESVSYVRQEGAKAVLALGSGKYVFSVTGL